jgi:hypothetical protein
VDCSWKIGRRPPTPTIVLRNARVMFDALD